MCLAVQDILLQSKAETDQLCTVLMRKIAVASGLSAAICDVTAGQIEKIRVSKPGRTAAVFLAANIELLAKNDASFRAELKEASESQQSIMGGQMLLQAHESRWIDFACAETLTQTEIESRNNKRQAKERLDEKRTNQRVGAECWCAQLGCLPPAVSDTIDDDRC